MPQEILTIFPILFIYFSLGWYYSFNVKLFAWIDFIWSSSFLLAIIVFLTQLKIFHVPKLILLSMYGLWSIRLSLHLFIRIRKKGEDRRYIRLMEHWKAWYGLKFYFLYMGQAVLVLILCLPISLLI